MQYTALSDPKRGRCHIYAHEFVVTRVSPYSSPIDDCLHLKDMPHKPDIVPAYMLSVVRSEKRKIEESLGI